LDAQFLLGYSFMDYLYLYPNVHGWDKLADGRGEMIEPAPLTRRLAAVLLADAVAYTRHMERDDTATYVRLRDMRDRIIHPLTVAHGGHTVDTAGDSFLAEFASAVAAVRAAIEIQRSIAKHNSSLPTSDRLHFRIGVNVGDLIVDGGRIVGDGVNVASRLEDMADAGGICISAFVYDQVHARLPVEFQDIGTFQVKNIQRPVRVYRVLDSEPGRSDAVGRWRRGRAAHVVGGWFAASLLTVGVSGSVFVPPTETLNATAGGAPLLSIAILPFATRPGGTADSEVADVITSELTDQLSRARGVHVASRALVAGVDRRMVPAMEVARVLNVRYLFTGEVGGSEKKPVVNVRLINASGVQEWSDRFVMAPEGDIHQARDVVPRITLRVREALFAAEARRIGNPNTALPASAAELLLRAKAVWARDPNSLAGALEARKLYDLALKSEPDNVDALLGVVHTMLYQLELDAHAHREALVQQIDSLTTRAVSIDPGDSRAWLYRADAFARQRRWAAAFEANDKAQELDPTRAGVLMDRAQLLIYTGQPVDALRMVDQALALDPRDPQDAGWGLLQRCRANVALGRFQEAVKACEQSVAQDDWWMTHLYLTAAYAQLGDLSKANTERVMLLKQRPGLTISAFRELRLSDDEAYLAQTERYLVSGLRKAGIDES
jgi:adenylate cyclase